LASFLGSDYPSNLGARTAPPAKDLMAFGSVLAHNQNQHNIGEFSKFQFNSIFFHQRRLQNIIISHMSNSDIFFSLLFFLQYFYSQCYFYARRWNNYWSQWKIVNFNSFTYKFFVVVVIVKWIKRTKEFLKNIFFGNQQNTASRHKIIAIFLSFSFKNWCLMF
jgi:hypothetical protein